MSVLDLTRLQATLGSPALGRLREALRRRLELGRELIGRLTLRDATPEERQACDDLFARRPTAGRSGIRTRFRFGHGSGNKNSACSQLMQIKGFHTFGCIFF